MLLKLVSKLLLPNLSVPLPLHIMDPDNPTPGPSNRPSSTQPPTSTPTLADVVVLIHNVGGRVEALQRELQSLKSPATSAPPSASTSSATAPPAAASSSAPTVVHFRAPEFPTFSGDPSKLGTWLAQTEQCLTLAGIPPDSAKAVSIASLYLRDNAMTMWNNLVTNHGVNAGCTSFADFARMLKENMGVVAPEITIRAKLATLRQLRTVEGYYKIYNDTLLQLPDARADLETREEFIRGLKSEVQLHVRRCQPSTYQEAVVAARSYEGTVRTVPRSSGASSSSNSGPSPMDLDALVTSILSKASSASTSRGRSSNRSPGRSSRSPSRQTHRSASRSSSPGNRRVPLASLSAAELQDLRDRKLCFYCRKPGHSIKDCPAKKSGKRVQFQSKN